MVQLAKINWEGNEETKRRRRKKKREKRCIEAVRTGENKQSGSVRMREEGNPDKKS